MIHTYIEIMVSLLPEGSVKRTLGLRQVRKSDTHTRTVYRTDRDFRTRTIRYEKTDLHKETKCKLTLF